MASLKELSHRLEPMEVLLNPFSFYTESVQHIIQLIEGSLMY